MTLVADQDRTTEVSPSTAPSPVEPPPPRRGRGTVGSIALPAAGAVVFVGLWEWTGRRTAPGSTWIPLTEIWAEFGQPGRAELIERAARATFGRALVGLAVGFALALMLATLASLVPKVRHAVSGASVAINSVPWVALGPLLMIVVSRDRAPSVIAGLAVFFPSFVAITSGLDAATRDQEDLCSALGTPGWRRFLLVRLPNALPSFVLGLKLAVPAALIGAVFGEWFGADRGLGLLLLTSMQSFRPGLLWAVGLLTATATMVAYGVLTLAERWVARRFALKTADVTPVDPPRRPLARRLAAWTAAVVGLVVAWDVYVRASGVSPLLMPVPGRVWADLAGDPGVYWGHAARTVRLGLAGLVAGLTIGALLAMATWWSRLLQGLLTPMVLVARSVPTLALLPVVAGILGYNSRTVMAIGVLISFFPAFVFTSRGLRSLPDGASDLMAVLGAPRRRVFRLVALPSSVRELGVALRMSAGVCVIAAVVAEFLIGSEGLGWFFNDAMGRQNINRSWAIALVIVAVSITAFAAATRVERALVRRLT